eukprot:gene10440-14023_t
MSHSNSSFNLIKSLSDVKFIVALFIFTCSGILFLLSSNSNTITNHNKSSLSTLSSTEVLSSSNSISYSLGRIGYENPESSKKYYKFLEKYPGGIIEPYVDMDLRESNTNIKNDHIIQMKVCSIKNDIIDTSDCQIAYYNNINNLQIESMISTHINFACQPFSEFMISIEEYQRESKLFIISNNKQNIIDTSNLQLLSKTNQKAICMYIRREIHTLTEEDLTRFLDASYVLNQLNDEQGRLKYGNNYRSAYYLLKFHAFNSGQMDSDHIHDGNGFLIQHVKLTNIFELSIQSVDPMVTLPYWDYTKEYKNNQYNAFQSDVFSSKLYGSMHVPTDLELGFLYKNEKVTDARILDGRWADLKTDMNNEYETLRYAYGYMRAPWNTNPSPYISRFTSTSFAVTLASCKSHYNLLSQDVMYKFFSDSAFDPHGGVHVSIGGHYGCDALQEAVEKGYMPELSVPSCGNWTPMLKSYIYRSGLAVPKKDCKINESNIELSSCEWDCGTTTPSAMYNKGIVAGYGNFINLNVEGAEQFWYDFICSGKGGKIFAGDQYESAAAGDPSFWIIHPVLERLLHAKLLYGGFKDDHWPQDIKSEYVCTAANCYNSETKITEYNNKCCYGHFGDSQLLDAISGNPNNYIGPTNDEVLKATDPRLSSYSMTYIYDHFEWSHCDENFDELLDNLSKQAVN